MKILYPNANGGISVIHPTKDFPVAYAAFKDVPEGIPYLFVNDEDIPEDRTFRNAWTADFSDPDGYGGQE